LEQRSVDVKARHEVDLETAKARLIELESKTQRLVALDAMSIRLAEVVDTMSIRLAEVVDTMSIRLAEVEREVNVLTEHQRATARRSGQLAKFISNKPTFQVFARQLGDSERVRIRELWGPALGIQLKDEQLAYFAHRTDKIEDTCIGRLATEVETAVIRALT